MNWNGSSDKLTDIYCYLWQVNNIGYLYSDNSVDDQGTDGN